MVQAITHFFSSEQMLGILVHFNFVLLFFLLDEISSGKDKCILFSFCFYRFRFFIFLIFLIFFIMGMGIFSLVRSSYYVRLGQSIYPWIRFFGGMKMKFNSSTACGYLLKFSSSEKQMKKIITKHKYFSLRVPHTCAHLLF